jgi:tetratricopeptide (TPR) repeat protein
MSLSFSIKAFSATLALLLVCATIWAGSADDLIKSGDDLDLKLKASEALDFYLAAEKLDPQNASLLVRIARQYRPNGRRHDARKRAQRHRVGLCAAGSGLAPNDSDAQLSRSASEKWSGDQADGSRAPHQGSGRQGIKLNPHNDLAWDVLGRWNKVLADVNGIKRALGSLLYGELPMGSNADAVLCFQKAIEINPNRLMHYIELGQTYAQMGKTADARRMIVKGLAMPDVEKDDPEIKRRGRETLAKLQ